MMLTVRNVALVLTLWAFFLVVGGTFGLTVPCVLLIIASVLYLLYGG